MAITPEQFQKIIKDTLREELIPVKQELNEKMDKIYVAVDSITKKYEDHESEHVANMAAHDRFQAEIDSLKKYTGLKTKTA